jgi:hypothetical protein
MDGKAEAEVREDVCKSPSAVQFALVCQLSSSSASARRTPSGPGAGADVDRAGSLDTTFDADGLSGFIDERGRRHERPFRPSALGRRSRAPSRPTPVAPAHGPSKAIRRRRSVTPRSLSSTIRPDITTAEQS